MKLHDMVRYDLGGGNYAIGKVIGYGKFDPDRPHEENVLVRWQDWTSSWMREYDLEIVKE